MVPLEGARLKSPVYFGTHLVCMSVTWDRDGIMRLNMRDYWRLQPFMNIPARPETKFLSWAMINWPAHLSCWCLQLDCSNEVILPWIGFHNPCDGHDPGGVLDCLTRTTSPIERLCVEVVVTLVQSSQILIMQFLPESLKHGLDALPIS